MSDRNLTDADVQALADALNPKSASTSMSDLVRGQFNARKIAADSKLARIFQKPEDADTTEPNAAARAHAEVVAERERSEAS